MPGLRRSLGWGGAILLAGALAAAAAPDVEQELAFASGLVRFSPSFSDFANEVVAELVAANPSAKDLARVVEAEILIRQRKLDEAREIIKAFSDTPAGERANLTLAENYFQIGRTEDAKALYDGYFRKYDNNLPSDPAARKQFQDAAYIYAQLLRGAGEFLGAADQMARVERAAEDVGIKRRMQVEAAQAYVRAAEMGQGNKEDNLKKAADLASKVQWGGADLPFVDSLVVLANIELARGRPEEARRVLDEYMGAIKSVDEALAEMGLPMRESPMAGARSMLGRLWKEEADRVAKEAGREAEAVTAYSKALNEYYNVFVKYGDSQWGNDAGVISGEIKNILEEKYGKTVKIDLPDNLRKKVAGTELQVADAFFRQQRYQEAVAEYHKVLAQYPEEGELSVKALASLAQGYANLDDPLYTQVVASYLAERFGGRQPLAAEALVSLITLYYNKSDFETAKTIFSDFEQYCPEDPRVASFLFNFARAAEKEGDQAAANTYYARIITSYTNHAAYPNALMILSWKAYGDKDYTAAAEGFKRYIEATESQPSLMMAQAMFALADSYRNLAGSEEGPAQMKMLSEAVKQFQTLVNELTKGPEKYAKTAEDRGKLDKTLENAQFLLGATLARLPKERFGRPAIAMLDAFLKNHPTSDNAPKALSLKGSLQMAIEPAKAQETYDFLATNYRHTDEGRNAQYTRISGALELGLNAQAAEAFNAMLTDAGRFSADEFAKVGALMQEAGLWREAISAYEQVVAKGASDSQLQRAYYGIALGAYELNQDAKSGEAIRNLLTKYPNTELFYAARFLQARAGIRDGNPDEAKLALREVFSYAKSTELVNEANLLLADLALQEGNELEALAAYNRIELYSSLDMKTQKEREQVATAILKGIDLADKMGRFAEVVESSRTFEDLFPTRPEISRVRQKRQLAALKLSQEVTGAE